jgi:uncharacterized membrane protein
MHSYKSNIITGVVFFLSAIICWWLFTQESSPLYERFLHNTAIPNMWVKFNIFPLFTGILSSGNTDQPGAIGFFLGLFIQWFSLGFILSKITQRIFFKNSRTTWRAPK